MTHTVKNCANREEWMGALLYGDLPFSDEAQADEHLLFCSECRSEHESLVELLGSLPMAPPAPVIRRQMGTMKVAVAAGLMGIVLGFWIAPRSAGQFPASANSGIRDKADPHNQHSSEVPGFSGWWPRLTSR